MIGSLFRRVWMEMLIVFDPNYTLEGFEKTRKPFSLPPRISEYEPSLKRRHTICNLYANQGHSMSTIAKVLDVSRGRVVTTLIEEGLIKERRQRAPKPRRHDKRHLPIVLEASKVSPPPLSNAVSELNPGMNPLGIVSGNVVSLPEKTSSTSNPKEDAGGSDQMQELPPIALVRKAAS